MQYVADEGDIERIEKKVDMLKESIDRLLGVKGMNIDRVTVADIARELGVSRGHLSQSPWLLPRFGKAESKRYRSWPRDEYEKWKSRSVEERKQEYWMMKIKEEQAANRERDDG